MPYHNKRTCKCKGAKIIPKKTKAGWISICGTCGKKCELRFN